MSPMEDKWTCLTFSSVQTEMFVLFPIINYAMHVPYSITYGTQPEPNVKNMQSCWNHIHVIKILFQLISKITSFGVNKHTVMGKSLISPNHRHKKDRPAILKRHRTIGRHVVQLVSCWKWHLPVASNDENTAKKNKFLAIKALKSTVTIK